MATTGRALIRVAPWLLAAFGVGMLLLATRTFFDSTGFGYDFAAYDLAAERIANGEPLYPPGLAEAYNSGAYEGLYLYPPPLAVALIPLAPLQADTAAEIWLWLRLVLLVLGVALLPVSGVARGAVMAVAGISFPVWYDLNLGNLSIVLFFLSALVWRFRWNVAGSAALAVAGVLRYPFGLVLAAWVLGRQWKAAFWTVVIGLVIGAATLPVVGVQGWLDYLATLGGLRDVSAGEHNLSFATTAAAFGLPGPAGFWVVFGMAIAGIAAAVAALGRDRETAVVVALTGTILFFPFFHPHYLVQLLIPAAFLAGRGQWWGLVLPLLGWLPGELMPPVAALATLLPLVPPRFLAFRPGDEPRDGATGFGTDPTRP